jgi:hypothetical protein
MKYTITTFSINNRTTLSMNILVQIIFEIWISFHTYVYCLNSGSTSILLICLHFGTTQGRMTEFSWKATSGNI